MMLYGSLCAVAIWSHLSTPTSVEIQYVIAVDEQ